MPYQTEDIRALLESVLPVAGDTRPVKINVQIIVIEQFRGDIGHLLRQEEDHVMTGDAIKFGQVSGSNVNVKSILANVGQSVQNMTAIDQTAKNELQALVASLDEALQQVPPERAEHAEAVAKQAEQLVEIAKQENPNRTLLRVMADGLKQAAQTVADVVPKALPIVLQIVDLIAKVRGL